MRTVVIIPARYASSRFPGKPLVPLKGAAGAAKSLTARVLEAAWAAQAAEPGIAEVYVATDDARIAAEAQAAGGAVLMTAPERRNGTERCAEAAAQLDPAPDLVVNLQGDAPLTPPDFIIALIHAMRDDPAMAAATPALRADGRTLRRFREDRAAGRVGGTTVVARGDGAALYFSKEIIPFVADDFEETAPTPVRHHVGLYAYRPSALAAYVAAEPSGPERLEGLEQLRFLEIGLPMRVVEVDGRGRDFWELNNPVDVARVEAALAAQGIA